eukprot:gene1919-1983_t
MVLPQGPLGQPFVTSKGRVLLSGHRMYDNQYERADHGRGRGGYGGNQKSCKFYRTKQGCKKGDNCNLTHTEDAGQDRSVAAAEPVNQRQRIGRGTCRDFFTRGCHFGDLCKYSHETDGDTAERNEEITECTVTVPSERIRLLLGRQAEQLNKINLECGTTNSKISRPQEYTVMYSFKVYGKPENVLKAKKEIEKLVGITKMHTETSRFEYLLRECDRNIESVTALCAANKRLKEKNLDLPEETLLKISQMFRYERRLSNVSQLFAIVTNSPKAKLDIITAVLKGLKAVQSIIFCSNVKHILWLEQN